MMAPAWFKSVAEQSIARSRVPQFLHRHTSDVLILAYHNIVPEGEQVVGERSLHLPVADFAKQLDMLLESHDVIALPDLLANPSLLIKSWNPRPRAIITFDDAYRGAITAGVQELVKRNIPATFFVSPAFLGGKTFWWDVFADRNSGELAPLFRASALDNLGGRDALIRSSAIYNGVGQWLPEHATCTFEEELYSAAAHAEISFGSHSWSHLNLTALKAEEVVQELLRSLNWLKMHLPRTVPCISYPYGLTSLPVQILARGTGYHMGFCSSGGWAQLQKDDIYCLPRVCIPAGLSCHGFKLKLAGLFC